MRYISILNKYLFVFVLFSMSFIIVICGIVHESIRNEDVNTVSLLLKFGMPPEISVNSNKYTLFPFLHFSRSLQVSEIILNSGGGINTKEIFFGASSLHHAIARGDIEIASFLISNGAEINDKTYSKHSYSPLIYATDRKYFDIMKILIDNSADVNLGDVHGLVPLAYAVHRGYLEGIKLLIENGSNLNVNSRRNVIPSLLHLYLDPRSYLSYMPRLERKEYDIKIINILLQHKIDSEIKDRYGNTPLDIARKKKLPQKIIDTLSQHEI